jgi:FkbM family methyltransferase
MQMDLEMAHFQIVQIGAHIGQDIFSSRIVSEDLRGLLIEPNPMLFKLLQERYIAATKLAFENVAIGDVKDTVEFHCFGDTEGMPHWADQTGSLSRDHVLQIADANGYLGQALAKMQSLPINVLTFMDLVEKYDIDSIDLLHIDAEGKDIDIILGIDFHAVQIREIIFEHKHADGFLTQGAGYAKAISYLHGNGFQTKMIDEENTRAFRV